MRPAFALLLVACATTAPSPAPPVFEPAPAAPPREALCPAEAPPPDETEGAVPFGVARVVKVCVFADNERTARDVEGRVLKREGAVLQLEVVRDDLRALFALGTLRDVHVSADVLDPQRVVLSYVVRDYPLIRSVKFEGAAAFPRGELLARAPPGERASPHALERLKRALLEHYRANGYADVHIETSGLEEATFSITEGQRFTVKAVRFEGVKRGRAAELVKGVEVQPGDPFRRDQVEEAQLAIEHWYYDNGMINAGVRFEPRPVKGSDGALEVVFAIEEGDVFRIAKVEVSGGPPGLPEKLRAVIEVKPGDVFSRAKTSKSILRLYGRARELGFLVDFTPQTSVDAARKTVELTFVVEKQAGYLPF